MSTKKLDIAKGLNLPVNAATQKLAWLGTTGSGKTYGSSKSQSLAVSTATCLWIRGPVS